MLLKVSCRLPFQMAEEIVAQIELDLPGNADDDPAGKEEEDALGGRDQDQQPGIQENLLPGDALVQIVDGNANDLGEKDPDSTDSSGRTPLTYATENGNARLVKLLLNYNVDINSKCNRGLTPLSRAIEEGSATVVQILLAKGVETDYRYILVRIPYYV